MVTDTYLPKIDGVVVSLCNATKYLSKKGHKIGILAPIMDENYKDKRQKNVKIYRFPAFSFPPYPEVRVSLPSIKKIVDIIKKFKPDIIHTHSPGTLGIAALVAAKIQNVPVISTYHTHIPDVLVYLSPIKLLKLDKTLEKMSGKPSLMKKPISTPKIQKQLRKLKDRLKIGLAKKKKESFSKRTVWAITNRYYNRVDLILAPSNIIKKEMLKHKIKADVKVISNGLHVNKFKKKTKYNPFPKFLHLGRISFEKKVDVVIKAMALVVKKYPEASLTIVGDGPAMPSLKELVNKVYLSKNVKFLGFVPREKISKIYRKHDVFVTASEMETQGLVLLESMSCGLPVVGVDVLAIPDVVHDNITGFCVKSGSVKRIANKMIKFIEEPNLAKKLGKNAREEAENHDIKKVVKQLEDTYKSVITE